VSRENVEIVRGSFEAWNRGDYSAALDLIDPEIEVVVAFQAENDGTYRGHAGVQEMMRRFWTEFEGRRTEVEEAIAVGSEVVLGVRLYGRGRRSGIEIDMPMWHVWRLREGKAVRWQVLPTKQEALEAVGLSE
jgi:ketosteroid isomerase-like protein